LGFQWVFYFRNSRSISGSNSRAERQQDNSSSRDRPDNSSSSSSSGSSRADQIVTVAAATAATTVTTDPIDWNNSNGSDSIDWHRLGRESWEMETRRQKQQRIAQLEQEQKEAVAQPIAHRTRKRQAVAASMVEWESDYDSVQPDYTVMPVLETETEDDTSERDTEQEDSSQVPSTGWTEKLEAASSESEDSAQS
jgi:hypothetical protein